MKPQQNRMNEVIAYTQQHFYLQIDRAAYTLSSKRRDQLSQEETPQYSE